MASLNIRVGASIDRSMQVAFRPLIESAKKAKVAIEAESKRAGRAISTETKKGVDEAERKFQELEREIMSGMPKATNAGVAAIKTFSKEASSNFASIKKNFADLARDAEKQIATIERSQKKLNGMTLGQKVFAAAGGEKGILGANSLTRSGRQALGIAKAGASAAFGLGAGMAKSFGVETDLGAIFRKNAELETMATQLSASGFMAGDARNGKRVSSRALMNEALDAGSKTGTDANEVMKGLQTFVGLTGDLQTGRDVMVDLLRLSKATGTEFDDMAAAAGNVAANLPESAQKGEQVSAVMRAIAGQGKMGAVEIKDLASQMARLAAQAGQFADKDVGGTVTTLGVMAQMSRSKGGSASAREATGSISSFVGMLKTKKRAEEFEKATGTKVFDQKSGMLRDPMKIIKEALLAKGMDPLQFKSIFQNMQGGRAVEGWATIFRQAGGGKAGLDAVDAEFERLKNATMATAEVEESFARALKTGQSQSEIFNQEMRKGALAMQDALLPALVALAPVVVDATKKFVDVTTKLFGGDQVEKNLKDTEDKTKQVLTSVATQTKGGKISTASEAELEKTQYDMKAAAMLADSDLNDAKKDRMGNVSKTALKTFDGSALGMLLKWTTGGELGQSVIDKESQNIQKKELEAKNAHQLYQEVANANKELHRKIDQGIVVRISNVEELKKATEGGPGIDPSGQTPSPEQKARGKTK